MNKSHVASILEFFNSKKMFKALDKKFTTTNAACHYQLFYNYQAINTQKNVTVVGKYKTSSILMPKYKYKSLKLLFKINILSTF